MTGMLSYMNFYKHEKEVARLLTRPESARPLCLVLSFRYVHNIDSYAMHDCGQLIEQIRLRAQVRVLITGLHTNLVRLFSQDAFFVGMI